MSATRILLAMAAVARQNLAGLTCKGELHTTTHA